MPFREDKSLWRGGLYRRTRTTQKLLYDNVLFFLSSVVVEYALLSMKFRDILVASTLFFFFESTPQRVFH
jgi:hypothetical protein